MNLWHDVPLGDNAPNEFNCIIEIPKWSHNKYEIDKDTGLIALDRVNYNAAPYPFDYAFAPRTLWDDGDALDVVLFTTHPLNVGVFVAVRPVGVMLMNDSGESDYKIMAVPVEDKRYDHVQDISDVSPHLLKDYAHFFETYKNLKGKTAADYPVVVEGYEGKDAAVAAVEKSIKLYNEKFGT